MNTTSEFDITRENLELFGHTNRPLLKGRARGIVVNFHGLGDGVMFSDYDNFDRRCAERGLIRLFPYYAPWSWLNKSGVRLTDGIISLLKEEAGEDLPVVSMGDSMGGCSAIAYTYLGCHKIIACAANSPVCDLVYHYSERPDVPRSIYNALGGEEIPLKEAVERISPMHNIEKLPNIPFLIVHGDSDKDVNCEAHSSAFTDVARKQGSNIDLQIIPGMTHCDMPGEKWEEFFEFIFDAFG